MTWGSPVGMTGGGLEIRRMRIIRVVEHAGFSKTIVGGEAIEKQIGPTDWDMYIHIYL